MKIVSLCWYRFEQRFSPIPVNSLHYTILVLATKLILFFLDYPTRPRMKHEGNIKRKIVCSLPRMFFFCCLPKLIIITIVFIQYHHVSSDPSLYCYYQRSFSFLCVLVRISTISTQATYGTAYMQLDSYRTEGV